MVRKFDRPVPIAIILINNQSSRQRNKVKRLSQVENICISPDNLLSYLNHWIDVYQHNSLHLFINLLFISRNPFLSDLLVHVLRLTRHRFFKLHEERFGNQSIINRLRVEVSTFSLNINKFPTVMKKLDWNQLKSASRRQLLNQMRSILCPQ